MRTKLLFFGTILCLMFIALGISHKVEASAGDNMYGYAWSGNIGWISFNNCSSPTSCTGTNYGVKMDSTTGILSGYAWSDNIGWISFQTADTSTCPTASQSSSASCVPKVNPTNGIFSGFARVLSYGDGWDGWVSLSGANASIPDGQGNRSVSGYSWGSDVLGWIDMSYLSIGDVVTQVRAYISVNPTTFSTTTGTTAITWSSTDATSCAPYDDSGGTPNWTMTTPGSTSGTETGITATQTTTYRVRCINSTQSSIASATFSNIVGQSLVVVVTGVKETFLPATSGQPSSPAITGRVATYAAGGINGSVSIDIDTPSAGAITGTFTITNCSASQPTSPTQNSFKLTDYGDYCYFTFTVANSTSLPPAAGYNYVQAKKGSIESVNSFTNSFFISVGTPTGSKVKPIFKER